MAASGVEGRGRAKDVERIMWQRDVPLKSGMYWTATRDGESSGLKVVTYDNLGKLVYAGGMVRTGSYWKGWWWSEMVEEPVPPLATAWLE